MDFHICYSRKNILINDQREKGLIDAILFTAKTQSSQKSFPQRNFIYAPSAANGFKYSKDNFRMHSFSDKRVGRLQKFYRKPEISAHVF
jgi:hypothetical protein